MRGRVLAAFAIGLLLAVALSCASAPTFTSTSTTTQASSILLPAPADSSEKLWGFIDRSSSWVIKPQFQDAYRFHEGLARVELNDRWGYVNESGALVVPAQYTEAYDFSEGLARVATGPADGMYKFKVFQTASDYGYIDKTGKMVIPNTWDDAGDFREGLAAVGQEDTSEGSDSPPRYLCGYIDKTGKLVIPLKFGGAGPFSEDLAAVWTEGGWGYIDKTGSLAIKPTPNVGPVSAVGVFDDDLVALMNLPVRPFKSGFAAVGLFKEPNPDRVTWQYIDKTGRATGWAGTFDQAGVFSEGLAPVSAGDAWGFIDTSGSMAIPFQFSGRSWGPEGYLLISEGFHQGLAAAATADGKVGYIDKTGNWVIQPQFVWGNGFLDGYAYVTAPDSAPTSTVEEGLPVPRHGPLEIIDLTGRVIYQAPTAPEEGSTGST
jgi:hypothetical protein